MTNITFKHSNDPIRSLPSNSVGYKINNKVNLNNTDQNHTRSNAFNNFYSLLIYHQNMRGINNKTEEILSQWESNLPHVFCFTEHHLTKSEITCTVITSFNLGSYFSHKSKENGGVSTFVHQNLQFTPTDLDEFCINQEIEICAVKLHYFSTNICILNLYKHRNLN
jgi:hypothetical protein